MYRRGIKSTFPLGRVVVTQTALTTLERLGKNWAEILQRHASRDWGDILEEEREQNNWAAEEAHRICSKYNLALNVAVWVVTDSYSETTTILMPWEE